MRNIVSLLSFICLTAISLTANAQSVNQWDNQSIAFELPDDFVPTLIDDQSFEAEGDGMEFGIYEFLDNEIDEGDIVDFTILLAASLDLDYVDDAYEIDLDGFLGAIIEGAIGEDAVILLGIIDPDSDANYYVVITFFDDDLVADDAATDILASIRRI